MEEAEVKKSVLRLSLRQFLEQTNQERPQITGGCVLLTNASLTSAMILMALKISHKKTKDPATRRFLRLKIKAFTGIQAHLADAADHDLEVFDQYRSILRLKSKNREAKLKSALRYATDSLLDVCELLKQAIILTEASKPYTDKTVVSDLNAGKLIFEAVFSGIIALAEGNIASMPAEEKKAYERWKNFEEHRLHKDELSNS